MDMKIALAGNPNCGKTTLFNALTGSSQYVGNWPGVTVEKSLKPGCAVLCTEDDLSQICYNLVENAIKYNNVNGWVKVSLDADHKFFTVSVEDSGIGIPEESLEHIFERFYRVDKSHSKEINGNGLGLAITRNAILMHRGAIKVRSVEGEGTKFFVKIPLNYLT